MEVGRRSRGELYDACGRGCRHARGCKIRGAAAVEDRPPLDPGGKSAVGLVGLAFVAAALALPSKPVLPTPTPRRDERGRGGLPQRPVPP